MKDQAAHFVQPDLDLHWLQSQLKIVVKDALIYSHTMTPFDTPGKQAF